MRVKKSISKNSVSYSIIKDIVRGGKRTSIVVEALGNHEELQRKYPGMEPEVWAKQRAEELTRQEQIAQTPIPLSFSPTQVKPLGKTTCFHGGYLFLQKIYSQLGLDLLCNELQKDGRFSYDLNEIFSRLLYLRVLFPCSKRKLTVFSQSLLEPSSFTEHQIYRALEVIAKNQEFLEERIYQNSKTVLPRNTQVLYYDCTNFFFEIEQEDDLRRYGVSKENRPTPLVQMGLFLDANGIPLAMSLHPGNTNEQITLRPLEERLLKDFSLSKFIVCTDGGLSSMANRIFNSKKDRAFITTQSIKNMKKHLKDWSLDLAGWFVMEEGKEKSGKKRRVRKPVTLDLSDPSDTRIYYKDRWIKENGLEQHLVVSFSPKTRRYQQQVRARQIERAIRKMENPATLSKVRPHDPVRFLHIDHVTQEGELAERKEIRLNEEVMEKEARFDGFYAVCTNLEGDPESIVRITQRRWEIEETFRMLKSDFKARPVYLQRETRIRAHFSTCFYALMLFRILEKKLGEVYTVPEILATLREMRFTHVEGKGYLPHYTRTPLTDALHEAFGFRTDYEILPERQMKEILKETKRRK